MEVFYLGGDVSKGYCDFIMLNQEKQKTIKNMQLDDTAKGHHLLESRLMEFVNEHPGCKIVAGVESTGGYENNWFETLLALQDRMDISVTRINPIGTHHSSKASLDRIVNDKKSAKTVAEYLINYKNKLNFRKPDKFSILRREWKRIRMLDKHRTQFYNHLERNLYNANPELLKYTKSGYPKWLLRVIKQYPTARDLAMAKPEKLSEIPYVSETRAKALVDKAKTSVASATSPLMRNIIVSTVKDIIRITRQIDKESKIIVDNCGLEEIEILKSFKGIGDYSAIGLIIHIGTVENFSNTKMLSSFSGMDPIWKESGDKISGIHISKKGNKEIRALLYNITFTAIRCNPLVREIYQKHLSKGKKKMVAIVACMNKVLRIIYGMLKHKENFNPEKDRANSQKARVIKKSPENKLRSLQPYDSDAPVSNKQYRKRKQQEMSKDELLSSNTGSVSHCSEIQTNLVQVIKT